MRIWRGLLGGVAIAAVLALSGPTASAQDWCGFHQKAGSRVKCGFSSLEQCKQALANKKTGDKAVTCMPDPAFG